MAKKKTTISIEDRLQQDLVPKEEQPYEVPGNCVWCKLGSVANWGSGGTPSRKHAEYYKGNIPWIKTGELKNDWIFSTEEHINQEAIDNSSAKLYPINTIVIAMYGATIGKVGIMGVEATTNQACACAVCTPCIGYRFLFWYCLSQKQIFIDKGKGGAQPNISQIIIKEHSFCLPPINEQRRIVARIEELFAKLDEAKENLQEVIDGFETRKAAILHKAFTGELTKKWREEHVVGMDSWEDSLLKDVCDVNPKKVDTKNLSDQSSVSFIPMAAVSDVNGCITEPLVKTLGEVKKGFTNFCEGDVILAKITPCMENGKSAVVGKLVNDIGFGSTEFYVLRTSVKLYNNYLYHIVRSSSFRDLAKGEMTGAVGQQRVPKSFIENFTIKLPRLDEQQEIVRIVDSLLYKEQKAKEAAKSVLEQIDLMKKSILARAFRGELGTNDPNEPSSIELLRQAIANNQNI